VSDTVDTLCAQTIAQPLLACYNLFTSMCTKGAVLVQQAGILGWGYYMPSQVLTNQDLEQMVDTSDEWIRTRTGILERRIADHSEATSDLAIAAARQALDRAKLDAAELDLIMVATVTPDTSFPSTACLVQTGLHATRAAAFDLSAACSGFIYGLFLAKSLINDGTVKNCLLVGAETLSRITDYQDRNTCVLFGDGAGAFVLGPSEEHTIRCVEIGADGSGGQLLHLPAGGSRKPASAETVSNHEHFIQMEGQEVFKFAISKVPEASLQLLANNGLQVADLDWFVPHQANKRIIDSVSKRLGIPQEKVVVNLQNYGNMSAASVPVALAEAAEAGTFQPGQRVLLAGFGGGLTWGTAIIEW
jgi:3-oxoacyl-[acyl-carrier-protein] synthase-3